MGEKFKRLLRFVGISKGESLSSLLYRAEKANHFVPVNFSQLLKRRNGQFGGLEDDVYSPKQKSSLEAISSLVEIQPEVLRQASAFHFSDTIRIPNLADQVNLSEENIDYVQKNLKSHHGTRYCPSCMKEGQYHRLAWQFWCLPICVKHQCILLDTCQNCGRKITIRDVAWGKCGHCEYQLSKAKSMVVDGEQDIYANQFLYHLIGFDGATSITLNGGLSLPKRYLFYFYYGLFNCLGDKNSKILKNFGVIKNLDHEKKSAEVIMEINRVIVNSLTDWPDGFYQMLDVYRNSFESKSQIGHGTLYFKWLEKAWNLPEYEPIQAVYDKYIGRTRRKLYSGIMKSKRFQNRPAMLNEFEFISASYAAEVMNTTLDVLKRRIDCGLLNYEIDPDAPDLLWLKREEVVMLKDQWQKSKTPKEAAVLLGISSDLVIEFAKAGLLEADRGTLVDGNSNWLISDKSIVSLSRNLFFCSLHIDKILERIERVDFYKAVQSLSMLGVNAVSLTTEILNKRIVAYRTTTSWNLPVSDIQFPVFALDDYKRMFLGEKAWIKQDEIAKKMGVKNTVVTVWIESGLIKPITTIGNAQYFDKKEVDDFVSEHVFTEQAAEILETGKLTVQKWARMGRLKPVSGRNVDGCHDYLFRKMDLLRLRENCIGADKMAENLGISRTQLTEWIKQKKIVPISGPHVDGTGRYLFDAL